MRYAALVHCIEGSLITTVVPAPSQSDRVWAKSEYCSSRFSRSSSLIDSCVGSLLLISSSFEVMVFIYGGS